MLHENLTRWRRLERYARWRQRGCFLLTAPGDVLALVVAHLERHDVLALVEALAHARLDIGVARDVARVPPFARARWVSEVLRGSLEAFVHDAAVHALFHARDTMGVVALVDWSPFAARAPESLATYSWSLGPSAVARSHVCVDAALVARVVARCMREERCAVRVTFHTVLAWMGYQFMQPSPFHTRLCYVLPGDWHVRSLSALQAWK